MQANCDFDSEIVISGISGRFPKSANLDEFWQNLIDGVDMVGDAQERYNVEEFDVPRRLAVLKNLDKFDADFFTLHGRQAGALDPRIRMILEVSYEAILDAGLNPSEIHGSNTGVFTAACDGAAMAISERSSTVDKFNIYELLGNVGSMLANRVSYSFNLNGPSYVVDTACSSSFVALQQALLSIRAGICDAAIVASVNTIHDPMGSHCFNQLKMTSPDGKCKSFDASADGYVRAEAVAAIYICKKQVAKRTYGTLVHAAINSDGYKEQGITFPSEICQEKVIRRVYSDIGLDPLEVDYIEAHGTGTKVGDPQEMTAVTKVFCEGRKGPLLIGSIKSNMGHPEPVAGLCAIAKVVLAHTNGVMPANLHYNNPNPDIAGLHDGRLQIVDKNQPFKAKYVGFNSMGFGGTNVHLLMKFDPKPELKPNLSPNVPVILICSGRTKEAVEIFLEKTLSRRQDAGFVRLTHELFKRHTPKHVFRGFVIADKDKHELNLDKCDYGREMWYIVTGLGSQWAGMSRDLIKFDVFKTSIAKTATVLLTNKFDIISLLNCGDPKQFEDFKNSVVSITTVQMALIDLLRSIGIQPDGIVGHSTGEVAAAYADGCLTQEQAALTSFARVRAVLESNLQPGMVASVGLTWEDAKKRCPKGVWPVIHNGEENVTIAGTPDDIKAFTKELASQGVFVKLVRSASFGFHSPLVAESGKLAKMLLEDIIKDPKQRSPKWLSSSVPEALWETDLARYCSADYYVNNGVNPVYFYPTLKHVPGNIVAIEVGPHCFMQSILKKSLAKTSIVLGLIHVKSQDNCVYFLNSVGMCYIAGISVDAAALYDAVRFPVSAATPNISSSIRWDHSKTFTVPRHTQELSRQKGVNFTFNLQSDDAFLEGHNIDGKILFPATGYIWMAWKCFAQQNGSKIESCPVVLENIRFERATILTNRAETKLVINIFNATGKFEVSESDMLVCTGSIRHVEEIAENEMFNYDGCDQFDVSAAHMGKEHFYKEMQLRGYGYSGSFQGVEQAHIGGKWAKIKWQGNWISFIDTILQTLLLQNAKRDLCVPLRIQKLTIDPTQITQCLNANESIMNITYWKKHNTITCYGLEFRGVTSAKLNRKSSDLLQATLEQTFLPYLAQPAQRLSESSALESCLEIAVDSCFGETFIFTEILKNPENMIGHVILNETIVKFPASDNRLVNLSTYEVDDEKVTAAMSHVTSFQDIRSGKHSHLIFVDHAANISEAISLVMPGGFVLVKCLNVNMLSQPDAIIVTEKRFETSAKSESAFILLKKSRPAPVKTQVINMDTEGYSWVETAKTALTAHSFLDRVYFVSCCPTSGVIGFFKCLIREYTSNKLRCFHAIDKINMNFEEPTTTLLDQLNKDLLINVYMGKTWGAFSNISIPKQEFKKQRQSSIAYADVLTLGDLSSLAWIESPLKNEKKDVIEVHYSALNFKDIMLASGKLAQIPISETADTSGCILGFEFSGTYKGKRVCGMGSSQCLATHVDPDKMVLLDIPESWSNEEASTVPCAYVTVYLALVLRGRMQPGESILIHAGSGGVGQAAIQLALSMKCKVFTTVSSKEKRDFLKARFPALTDDCITNSRSARDFESHIHEKTNGRGVNLVLNSLAQDKLYASIRCLANNGRFLEIGKFDIINDTKLGLSVLSKGVGVFGIFADKLVPGTGEVQEIIDSLQSGMKSGVVRPLTYLVFKHSELEAAFRFMAQGKHVGKVLIQVKEQTTGKTLIDATPKTYFLPTKSYIIIGGLGGMGFELANWLVQRGATKIVLSSRSENLTSYHEYHVEIWKRRGVNILLDNSDVSTLEGSRRLLANANALATVGGIFNTAVLLKDALFNNQSSLDFETVGNCKAQATTHLDNVSRQVAQELDYFVIFSSIITARGNPGQTNYGYANSVMERICEQRRLDGLPALAVQWGAVGDVGVFHRTMKDKNVFGLAPQSLKSCLETLDLYLHQDRTVVCSYIPFYRKKVNATNTSDNLVSVVANILGIKDTNKINPKTPLVELGMDSLMAAELGQVLQSRANLQLSQKGYSLLTFEKLAEIDTTGGNVESNKTVNTDFKGGMEICKVLSLKTNMLEPLSQMKSLQNNDNTIFVVHPIDGSVVMLEELVRHLNSSAYGLQCSRDAPLESIETLAAFYVSKIKQVQQEGPYKIVGYSFGASVAFEMTLQLERQNKKVELVLLDGSPMWKHLTDISGGEDLHGQWENAVLLGFLTQYIGSIAPVVFKELKKRQPVQDKLDYTARVLHESFPDTNLEDINFLLSSFLARAECGKKYEPSVKIKAKTVLLKATKTKESRNLPPDYGLRDVCEEELNIIEVEGNHYCFYEKPLELCLPDILNKILE